MVRMRPPHITIFSTIPASFHEATDRMTSFKWQWSPAYNEGASLPLLHHTVAWLLPSWHHNTMHGLASMVCHNTSLQERPHRTVVVELTTVLYSTFNLHHQKQQRTGCPLLHPRIWNRSSFEQNFLHHPSLSNRRCDLHQMVTYSKTHRYSEITMNLDRNSVYYHHEYWREERNHKKT